MPRTPAYVSPFEFLVENRSSEGLSRRGVMAAGVAAALAAPISELTAAPLDVVTDWPEWSQWLALISEIDARCASSQDGWSAAQVKTHDNTIDDLIDQASLLEDAMIEMPIRTERQGAMLFAIPIWRAETKNRSNSFDLRNVQIGHQPIFGSFLKAAAPRYARLLPEVPFVLAEV